MLRAMDRERYDFPIRAAKKKPHNAVGLNLLSRKGLFLLVLFHFGFEAGKDFVVVSQSLGRSVGI